MRFFQVFSSLCLSRETHIINLVILLPWCSPSPPQAFVELKGDSRRWLASAKQWHLQDWRCVMSLGLTGNDFSAESAQPVRTSMRISITTSTWNTTGKKLLPLRGKCKTSRGLRRSDPSLEDLQYCASLQGPGGLAGTINQCVLHLSLSLSHSSHLYNIALFCS